MRITISRLPPVVVQTLSISLPVLRNHCCKDLYANELPSGGPQKASTHTYAPVHTNAQAINFIHLYS